MVTREEMHSTRGRAHLLHEMLEGNPLKDGWRDDHVAEALDLCLSCKGCKHDCPVNVDVATYKAEFLSHYYAGRLRPRHAYASGLIHWWSTLASYMPATANFFTQTPGLSSIAKFAAGYSQKREIPAFAPQTFKQWFKARGVRNTGKPSVILWADTFNNHFTPKVAQAAVEVLEDAGFRVMVPAANICCGRPLYDFGMLSLAKKWLLNILNELRTEIQAGTPVVGLEPSCVSVFRDEMPNLLHNNQDAARLTQQTYILSEFLADKVKDYKPPQIDSKALVHGHCHHKSVLRFTCETDILTRTGLDTNLLESGCCGMAGAFGYEQDHYQVGLDCGERVLLPAVRNAAEDTLIVTDGFSCREMIQQETGRHALHFAQVLQMGLHGGLQDLPVADAERRYGSVEKTPALPAGVLVGGGALLLGALLWRRNHGTNNG
jgi:Fe-S oxidoreductase